MKPFVHCNYGFWKVPLLLSIIMLIWLLFVLMFCKITLTYNYWKRHKIPFATPIFPLGNLPVSFIFGFSSISAFLRNSYENFKDYPYHGIYMLGRPILMINDPRLIRSILVENFNSFTDRGWFVNERIDPMSNNLFLQPHEKWMRLRRKFTPVFTLSKLRNMHPIISNICETMVDVIDVELEETNVLEMSDIMGRYSTDVILTVVYGLDCSSLVDPNNEYRRLGTEVFQMGNINILIGAFFPELLNMVYLPLYKAEVKRHFMKTLQTTIENRLKHRIRKNDFVDLLIELIALGQVQEDQAAEGADPRAARQPVMNADKLTELEAAAQALVFFLAGYETSASTTTFCLYELARNRDIQVRLQQEIDGIAQLEDGFSYNNIQNLRYLDNVVSETLRLHAIVPFLSRICTKDFRIPESEFHHGFTVPKGMRVLLSINGIQSNPEYYPNPEIFDPDRFNRENRRDHYTYLIFGHGPRNCIGMTFGKLEVKVALTYLLYNYNFYLSDETRVPLEYDNSNLMHIPRKGIHLHVTRRRHDRD